MNDGDEIRVFAMVKNAPEVKEKMELNSASHEERKVEDEGQLLESGGGRTKEKISLSFIFLFGNKNIGI